MTYTEHEQTRDHVLDLLADLKAGPGAAWTDDEWNTYRERCERQIEELLADGGDPIVCPACEGASGLHNYGPGCTALSEVSGELARSELSRRAVSTLCHEALAWLKDTNPARLEYGAIWPVGAVVLAEVAASYPGGLSSFVLDGDYDEETAATVIGHVARYQGEGLTR